MEIAFIIILIHWVGDFVLQTDKQAKGKSKNWNDLLSHTTSYSLLWTIVGTFYTIKYNLTESGIFDLMLFVGCPSLLTIQTN